MVLTVAVTAVGHAGAAIWAAATGRVEAALDLGIGALAAVGVAMLVAEMGTTPSLDIGVDGGVLVVSFHGWDRLWVLRREVRVPLEQIERIGVLHVESMPLGWFRHRGTAVPGVIVAGSFASKGARELWDVRNGAAAVDVELDASARFRRLVLEVPDPPAVARQLQASAGFC